MSSSSSSVLNRGGEESEVVSIEPMGSYIFPPEIDGIRIVVQWISKQQGIICDLDVNALMYDERARYSEKIDGANRESKDSSCLLMREVDPNDPSKGHHESMKIDFRIVKASTSAIIVFLDGGPRNFQYLQSVSIICSRVKQEKSYGGFLPQEDDSSGKTGPLFQITGRTRKSYKGLVVCAFYKDGWDEKAQAPRWVAKSFMEPIYVSSLREKQERCTQLVIGAVPALEKFRPRLFASIRDICAALSSHALPKLKKKFQKNEEGLPIGQFTDVLFKQLFETYPKIIEEAEAPYTVAMLQEMFHQIDYNGDGSTNWDEFTSFCVQTGLTSIQNKRGSSNYSLEQYVIEYGEEVLQRDHVLSAYRFVTLMRHVPETHKLLVISEDSDYVLIMDEKFRTHSQLYPNKVQVIGSITKSKAEKEEEKNKSAIRTPNAPRAMVYDIVYLSGRDMYAYTSSDHSITVCRELSSMEGMKVNYLQHNRFYHTLLHLKLCWSQKHNILCSTASDRVIYGWNIDTAQILFQISRHSDIITDFIAVDHLDVFITCSMDKRIVLWSATSRRVKGVLLGHKRGVRCLSVYENTLLSAGFECEANTWDLINKDQVAILKGHRHPIVAAKLMCDRAQSEREHRAITVDESGEFRLWNIYVRERATDPVALPSIQIFEMQNSEAPLNQFRFLALPYNPQSSTSYYSNLIACSTKLLHFLPEKNMKEFVPPTAFTCNEASALLITAVGKSILTYDLTHGVFTNIFENIWGHDIFSLCMDGERGRRMYVGTGKGELLLLNSMTGALIDSVKYHEKEITAICQRLDLKNCTYSCSMDGNVRMYDETGGKLHLQNSVDKVFGDGVGIMRMKHVPSLHLLVLTAAGRMWGLMHDTTFKKMLVLTEADIITGMEIIGASRDKEEEILATRATNTTSSSSSTAAGYTAPSLKENLLTVAIALTKKIVVYTLDIHDLRGIKTFELTQDFANLYITDLCLIRSPDLKTVNYAFIRSKPANGEGYQLVAVSDDGKILIWDTETESIRMQSENKHRQHFRHNTHARKHHPRDKKKDNSHAPPLAPKPHPSELTKKTPNSSGTFLTATDDPAHSAPLPASKASAVKVSMTPAGVRISTPDSTVKSWLEVSSAEFFPLAFTHNGKLKKNLPTNQTYTNHILPAVRVWNGHNDMIPVAVSLPMHSCFATVSHDGYHRVWNLDMECLGELVLPNITEHMKNQAICKEPGTQWRFILERIPVTKHHHEIANVLIKSLKQTRQEKILEHQNSDRRHFNLFGFKGFRESLSAEDDEGHGVVTKVRMEMLKSLQEPPSFVQDVAPNRVPTKEEKELIKLSLLMDNQLLQNSVSSATLNSDFNETAGASTSLLSPSNSFIEPSTSLPTAPLSLSLPASGRAKTPLSPLRIPSSPSSSRGHSRGGKRDKEMKTSVQESTLKNSLLFGGDQSVCMSCFGLPSLWIVPGEKDIYGNTVTLQSDNPLPEFNVPPAFSEASVNALQREGLIDTEGRAILRKIGMNSDRVQVYDRSQPTLLIRNPGMSTSIQLPALEQVRKTEINFGIQKDMYKNAEKLLNEKANVSKSSIRSAVTLTRIDQNIRKVHSMIHLIQPPSHDEVILPKNNLESGEAFASRNEDDPNKARQEENRMKIRLMKSAALVPTDAVANMRPLDRESIDRWVSKMNHALEQASDNKNKPGYYNSKKHKKRETISQAMIINLERKLAIAIKGEFRARLLAQNKKKANNGNGDDDQSLANDSTTKGMDESKPNTVEVQSEDPGLGATAESDLMETASQTDSEVAVVTDGKKTFSLTTRQLLPYYKLETVHQFMDIFAKVDENFSGDLDVNEWIKLFSSLNESVPEQEARMIFMKIDKDNDGVLSMRELIPVVFNKASKDQQRLIIQYAEMELTKKVDPDSAPKVTSTDLEFLFEAYDSENVGFVDVVVIKDRVRRMRISEQALFFFMEMIADLADDEMVNLVEFKRLFKAFTARKK